MSDRADRIREAFEDIPRIEDPDELERYSANKKYPAEVVPEDGPVPDPRHDYRTEATVEVPDWVVYSLEAQLTTYDDPDEDTAKDVMLEIVQVYANHVTKDGDRVIGLVLGRLAGDNEKIECGARNQDGDN